MDPLLRKEILGFTIDAIFINEDDSALSTARIVPHINSEFFPPFHVRYITFSSRYLERRFYEWRRDSEQESNENGFTESVKQGGYYLIPTADLKFSDIAISKDVFADRLQVSPYQEEIDITLSNMNALRDGLIVRKKSDVVKIYCFDVGQGDSFLIISSNGNAYLVDVNIPSLAKMDTFINHVKDILLDNGLDQSTITALIITHKHLDHIRGGANLIESNKFKFDSLLMNFDYPHVTKASDDFIAAAKKNINNLVNVNSPNTLVDGDTTFTFFNPDSITSDKSQTPDINDSSICFTIDFQNQRALMTGDASCKILIQKIIDMKIGNPVGGTFVKIAHHGSNTGTKEQLLDRITPEVAFISAGDSKKYNHPHAEVLDLMDKKDIDYSVSKYEKRTIIYQMNINGIQQTAY